MQPFWTRALVGAMSVSLWTSVCYAQSNAASVLPKKQSTQPGVANAQKSRDTEAKEAAEFIVAREEAASGRSFDVGFRAAVLQKLASRSLDELDSIRSETGKGLDATFLFGLSSSNLVYNPITPCRIIDTRVAGGPIVPGTNRSFVVTGSTGFSAQGGNSTGCGVPFGPATAAVINFVAVSPAGGGDLRVTPFGTAMPLASILNYAAVPGGLNVANGPSVTLCDPSATTCTYDITMQADVSSVQLVADVQGYFAAPSTIPVGTCGTNDVSFGGHCYYLDGSAGVCDPGYSLQSESVLNTVATDFVGLNYKHTVSGNCCIYNVDPTEDWGMTNSCNVPGPFTSGDPAAGAFGCSGQSIFDPAQLTLCGK